MGGGSWKGVAVGAGGGACFADAVKEGLKKLAKSRAQLSQDAPPVARKTGLRFVDGRRVDAENPVGAVVLDRGPDYAWMERMAGL